MVDNKIQDVMLTDIKPFKGTKVSFKINQAARKDLKKLFAHYTNSDYEFDKTKVRVRLSGREDEFISRSQAKRLLLGMEKFRSIILDFKKVEFIDSACLGALVGISRRLKSDGGDLTISGLQDEVRSIFQITRLDKVFPLYDDVDQAINSFS